MKVLTKEEEEAHYRETLKGGIGGGIAGLGLGAAGVWAAAARYPAFRALTVPLRAFLVTSSGTFAAIISADHYSRAFEKTRNPEDQFEDSAARARAEARAQQTTYERFMNFGKENRYKIVGGSWIASMALALTIVGRSPYLSTTQKLVQARVYAQSLTIAVLILTAVFEIGDRNNEEGRWETVKYIDPDDPEHKKLVEKKVHHERYAGEDQWKDMVAAEEQREKARADAIHEQEERDRKEGKIHHKKKKEHKENGKKKDEGEGEKGSRTNESKNEEKK
ncbi:MAG: hypothetical protein Q9216_001587 [Gyalolechia sp. 2 TL-2023]